MYVCMLYSVYKVDYRGAAAPKNCISCKIIQKKDYEFRRINLDKYII